MSQNGKEVVNHTVFPKAVGFEKNCTIFSRRQSFIKPIKHFCCRVT